MAIDGNEPPTYEQLELKLNKPHEKNVKKTRLPKKKPKTKIKEAQFINKHNSKKNIKTTITQETSLQLFNRSHVIFYALALTLFLVDIVMLTIHSGVLTSENINLVVSPDLTDPTQKNITLFILWIILFFTFFFFSKCYFVINKNNKNIKEHQPDLNDILGNDHRHHNTINVITFVIISVATILVALYFILVCMATLLGWQIPYLNTFSIFSSPLDWVPIIQE